MATANLRFDMRVPSFSGVPSHEVYAAALDMAAFADEHGFQIIVLSEHHGVEDGYLPSIIPFAGAIVGRTQKIGVMFSALLAPLYDPVRLAEDLAVLDIASRGRVFTTAGLGYRPEEYAAVGKDFKKRGALMDECIATLLDAWTGEPFEYRGATVRVTPRPFTQPHPFLIVGGSAPVAARRAARFGLPFGPPLSDPELNQIYLDECARLGVATPFVVDPGEPWMCFVSKDPDATWKEIGPYYLHDATTYASWQRQGQSSYQHSAATTIDELRAEGKFRVLTPEECLAYAEEHGDAATFNHFPLGGGIPPEIGWKSLRLFADEVVPHLP